MQHCDIKPSNLLLMGNKVKVADFGLCAGAGWQTHHGGWRGTPPYAAPELYRGAAAAGTDQFALAVTFCRMVMWDRPFWPGDPTKKPTEGPPIDLTKLRDSEFPVISRALHPFPSARYPSCQAFVEALRLVCERGRQASASRIYPRGK